MTADRPYSNRVTAISYARVSTAAQIAAPGGVSPDTAHARLDQNPDAVIAGEPETFGSADLYGEHSAAPVAGRVRHVAHRGTKARRVPV